MESRLWEAKNGRGSLEKLKLASGPGFSRTCASLWPAREQAQDQAEAARPYAERMERMVGSLADSLAGNESAPALLRGTGADQTHLILVSTLVTTSTRFST